MATERQQFNLRLPGPLVSKIRVLSRFHHQSVNEWAVSVLQTLVEEEFRQHRLEELGQDLARVAQQYLPGRAVGADEMLELAELFAEEDVSDGVETRHAGRSKTGRAKQPGERKPRPSAR